MKYEIYHSDFNSDEERERGVNLYIDRFIKDQPDMKSYSILMFYENRIPIRIRNNRRASSRPMNSDKFTLSNTEKAWIEEWITGGKGIMIMETTKYDSINDCYPARTLNEGYSDDGTPITTPRFHYFTGRFGSGEFWETIRSARRRNYNVPMEVVKYMRRHHRSDIMDSIRLYDEENEEYTNRNFSYSVYDDGECILAFGRNEDEGEYEHYHPNGHNEIHRRNPFGWRPDE